MSKAVIGIDPDSKAHGVAVYLDGELIELKSLPLIELMKILECYTKSIEDVEVHIEDVCANNAVFMKPKRSYSGKDLAEVKARSRKLGMVQQSQTEIERACENFNVKLVKHKISKRWKKEKAEFEKITGWGGRSNEDTRSAAYFGYLGVI